MAIVAGRWFCVLEGADKQGPKEGKWSRRYELGATDYAGALVIQAAIIAAWSGISNAEIMKVTTYQEYYEDAYAVDTSHGERENCIRWAWELPNANKSATTTTPAPVEGILVALSGPSNNVLDLADAAVLAWETLYTNGDILVSDGETATDLQEGFRVHFASTRKRGVKRG